MFASDKRVSLFGNNVDVQDVSFSSYLNENTTMVVKLTHPSHINLKKKVEDGEIGIFGAEKYFKGAMDDQLPRTPRSIKPINYPPKDQQEKDEEPPKPKTASATPSVRSEASWNSRSGLLTNGSNQRVNPSRREKTSTVKSLLTSLGCNCNDKASVKIAENKVHVNEPVKPPTKVFAGGFNENKIDIKREDCFAFPVLNTRPIIKSELPKVEEDEITHVKTRRNSLEAFGSPILEKGKKSFSLERKLTMLNWDGVTPRSENIDLIGENNDAASDVSSDLFEIESFSTNGNSAFLARQVSNGRSSNATLPNGYAPSEASIAWSVVTASVTGFSIISDYEDTRASKTLNMNSSRNIKGNNDMEKMIKGNGILSGCNTHKSVRVAGEHVLVSSGEKGTIMKFQADTKTMSSLPRGHSPRAAHHLYIQQQ